MDEEPNGIQYDVDYSFTSEKGEEGEEISHTECRSIGKIESTNSIDYILEGCDGKTDTTLLFKIPNN